MARTVLLACVLLLGLLLAGLSHWPALGRLVDQQTTAHRADISLSATRGQRGHNLSRRIRAMTIQAGLASGDASLIEWAASDAQAWAVEDPDDLVAAALATRGLESSK
ncbi:MAG: hypothetical protein ACI9WU_002669 [Myxococcota bacterium]|jgi:hypothetical protein